MVTIDLTAVGVAAIDAAALGAIRRRKFKQPMLALTKYPAEWPLMRVIANELRVDPAEVRVIRRWAFGPSARPTGRHLECVVAVGGREWHLPAEVLHWIQRRAAVPRDRMPAEAIRFTLREASENKSA